MPGVTTGVGYMLYKYRISRIGIAEYIEDIMKNIYRKTSGNWWKILRNLSFVEYESQEKEEKEREGGPVGTQKQAEYNSFIRFW